MEMMDAVEQAYLNGYSAGFVAGKRSSGLIQEGDWVVAADGCYIFCSNCKHEPESGKISKFCSECGSKMRWNKNV